MAKDVFGLAQLVLLPTNDIPKKLIDLARRYDAEGDEELSYVHYRRYARLVVSMRRKNRNETKSTI